MKRILVLLALVLAAASLFASGQEEGTAKSGGFSIALLDANNNNSWRIQMEKNMQKLIDGYKADGLVSKYVAFSANDEATVQSQQMDQLVNQGVDAILVNPVSATSLNPIIDKAIAKGILVVSIDSTIDHPQVINVTNDQYEYARIHVNWLVEQLGGTGDILQFNAIAGVPANDQRESVYKEVLAQHPGIHVLKTVYQGWNTSKAKQLMTSLLPAYPNFDAILTQETTPGIIAALVEAGHPLPKAINGDESIEGLRTWAKYKYNSIMVENPPGVGPNGLQIAVNLLQGKKLKPSVLVGGNTIMIKPTLVITNETRDEWVEKTKDLSDNDYIDHVMTPEEILGFFE